jgi:hypothetical protein
MVRIWVYEMWYINVRNVGKFKSYMVQKSKTCHQFILSYDLCESLPVSRFAARRIGLGFGGWQENVVPFCRVRGIAEALKCLGRNKCEIFGEFYVV